MSEQEDKMWKYFEEVNDKAKRHGKKVILLDPLPSGLKEKFPDDKWGLYVKETQAVERPYSNLEVLDASL